METRKWILTVLMMITLFTVAFAASDTTKNRFGAEKRQAFYRDEVMPVLREQHQKLLDAMSAEDAAIVRALGTEMRDNMLVFNELRCELQATRIRNEVPAESLLQEIEAQRIMMRSVADRASSVAQKYEGMIDMLMDQAHATIRESLTESEDRTPRRPPVRKGFRERPGRGADSPLRLSPEVRFMLWSGRQV